MATLPYFVLGPNSVLSALGLVRGPDRTVPTPAENWRDARVDVIIPALNEQEHVALAIASVLRQTLRPRHIVLVDDGSEDQTVEVAEAYCSSQNVEIITIRRRKPIGKTPTIKRQARELDSDVEFILDADTILESPDYIARTVQELYQAAGIGSACGTILPLRRRVRDRWASAPDTLGFSRIVPRHESPRIRKWVHDLSGGITNLYREVLYLFLQKFVYHGQMEYFGSTANPVGCAVAYRRKYVKSLFDHFSPLLGDDLTNSEDIFIGLAMLDEGYRNIQLTDVYAWTVEPGVHRLPQQVYLWSSAFLQSCFYFDPLVKSPLRVMKRAWDEATGTSSSGGGAERRRVREPYRQAFGRRRTEQFGRPAGWLLMMGAVEKVFFPTALLVMAILGNWRGLALTVVVETSIGILVLAIVMKGRRLEYIAKGLAVAPMRYALAAFELVTLGRFANDMWLTRNRKWRK
jgi:glycosyltransferase involved in cell wall biosynthesis